jgi:hypothetical protein
MEPLGSLPCLQYPATCPYLEPVEFNPRTPLRCIYDIILQLCSSLLSGLLQVYPTQNLSVLSPTSYVPHISPVSSFLILLPE